MIDLSTKKPEEEQLLPLLQNAPYYYLKSNSIVKKIEFNGRRFYSRYRKIEQTPDIQLLREHLKAKLTLALPLKKSELSVEYFGDEPKRFLYLLKRVTQSYELEESMFWEDSSKKLVALLKFREDDLEKIADEVSLNLSKKLQKEWRILPDRELPKSYNIFRLPR